MTKFNVNLEKDGTTIISASVEISDLAAIKGLAEELSGVLSEIAKYAKGIEPEKDMYKDPMYNNSDMAGSPDMTYYQNVDTTRSNLDEFAMENINTTRSDIDEFMTDSNMTEERVVTELEKLAKDAFMMNGINVEGHEEDLMLIIDMNLTDEYQAVNIITGLYDALHRNDPMKKENECVAFNTELSMIPEVERMGWLIGRTKMLVETISKIIME